MHIIFLEDSDELDMLVKLRSSWSWGITKLNLNLEFEMSLYELATSTSTWTCLCLRRYSPKFEFYPTSCWLLPPWAHPPCAPAETPGSPPAASWRCPPHGPDRRIGAKNMDTWGEDGTWHITAPNKRKWAVCVRGASECVSPIWWPHRHTDTQTHRHTDTQTHTQTHTHICI